MKERTYGILRRIAGLILLALASLILVLQVPAVQTRIASSLISRFLDKFDGKVSVSEVNILALNAFLLKDITITDNDPMVTRSGLHRSDLEANPLTDSLEGDWEPEDTLFHAGSISATFTLKGLLDGGGLHLGRVDIDDAVFNYIVEPDSIFSSNLTRIFRIVSDDEEMELGNLFDLKTLNARNIRYTMRSPEDSSSFSGGINYFDMDVTVSSLKGRDLRFTGGKMYAVCESCSAKEKSGYELLSLTGSCVVGQGKTIIDDIHLVDSWSDLRLDCYTMSYLNADQFSDYIHSVRMGVEGLHGTLGMQTINAFSGGALPDNRLILNIKDSDAEGYVDDLDINALHFTASTPESDSILVGTLRGRITGLPEIEEMALDARAEGLRFAVQGLGQFVSNWTGSALPATVSGIAPGQVLELDAEVKGLLNRAQIKGTLGNSATGRVEIDALVSNLLKSDRLSAEASVSTKGLDVSKIMASIPVHGLDLHTKAGLEMKNGSPCIRLDSLGIGSVSSGSFTLAGISASGYYDTEGFELLLDSRDPDAQLSLAASGKTPSDGESFFRISSHIGRLDISAPGGTDPDGKVHLSAYVDGSLRHSASAATNGLVQISGIELNNCSDTLHLGSIRARLDVLQDNARISLESDYLNASYEGSSSPAQALRDIQALTTRKQLPVLYKDAVEDTRTSGTTYAIHLDLHNPYDIVSMLKPSLYVSDSTYADINVDANGLLSGKISSPRIAFNGNYLKNARIDFDNYDCLNAGISGESLYLGGIVMSSPALTAYVQNNGFNIQLHYDTLEGIGGYGELYVDGELSRDKTGQLVVKANPLDSYVSIDNNVWEFNESEIIVAGKDIKIDNFVVSSGFQRLMIDGGLSVNKTDTLDIYVDDLELSLLDEFFQDKVRFSGLATGHGYLISPVDDHLGFMVRMGCEDVMVDDNPIGNISLAGTWEDETRKIRAFLGTYVNDKATLSFSSTWGVDDKVLDAHLFMDQFEIGFIQPLTAGTFSRLDGSLSGNIAVKGSGNKLEMSSTATRLNKIHVAPAFTGVEYLIDGPFSVNNDGLQLNSLSVSDNAGGRATIEGALGYNEKTGPTLDALLRMSNLLVLDTDNATQVVYGDLRASGEGRLKGPLSALSIDADIRTAGDGNVYASLNSSMIGNTSDLLTFVEKEKHLDHYEMMMQKEEQQKRKSKNDISIHARLGVSPGVNASVEIDKTTGSMASVYGNGNVILDIRPSKNLFNVNGDYIVSGGSAKISAAGIVDRMFTIKEGGSVKFGGDILHSELDLTALYTLKTSLATLLADTSAVATRRTVECGITVSDKILNPNISFSVNVPDLDPATKSQVESALNTEDKVQRQFVSLLLFGSFMPDEYSGVQNNSNVLLSNIGEFMAGQISSILQKLDIPLDLGFGYQQNELGTDIFDVALSTQLFNNRVIINGSFGNRQYKMNSSGSDVVGDVDVAIKVGRQGNFRVNLFSHSADDYTSYLDYSQRSGAGVSYQKEYNSWKEFFRGLFPKKQRRNPQQDSRETGESGGRRREEQNGAKEGTVVINIE